MRRRTYIYMYESDYLCIDNGISGNMEIYPRIKIYPYMNALETIIHLKFRKYSNFLRILNLSHLSTSQTPRTFSIHVTPLLNPLPRGEDLPSPQGLKRGVSHLRNLSHIVLTICHYVSYGMCSRTSRRTRFRM